MFSPLATCAGLKPCRNVLGSPHSLLIITFWRGWYQKSYPKGVAFPGASQLPLTVNVVPSTRMNPPAWRVVGQCAYMYVCMYPHACPTSHQFDQNNYRTQWNFESGFQKCYNFTKKNCFFLDHVQCMGEWWVNVHTIYSG